MIPNIDNWIIDLGAVVGALVVIIGALWKYLISPIYNVGVGDKIDLLTEKIEASTQDTAAQLAKVHEQLRANGGSSLKDQTNRIEAALNAHIVGERERARIVSVELAATNQRIETALAAAHRDRIRIAQQAAEHEEHS